jgi:DNA-binding transcriptional MerR regulator
MARKTDTNSAALLTASAVGRILGIAGSSVTALAKRGKIPFQFDSSNRIRLYRQADAIRLHEQRQAQLRREAKARQ